LKETASIWSVAALVFVATILLFRQYFQLVRDFGDSAAYIEISNAIRSWNFSGIHVKHFWGLPYGVAALSRLTGISSEVSIVLVCAISSLTAVILAYRLWGGWIAVFASVLSFDWWQRSFLGGSEPLFVALLFASFLAIRKQRWQWAALLAALATITRPLGIFLLAGIVIALLRRRDWRGLTWSVGIAAFVGLLYILPLRLYLHDPLATVHSYGISQSTSYPPLFGVPFRAIIVGTLRYPAPVTSLLLTLGWIFLVTAGTIAMFATREFRNYAKDHLAETVFAALYLWSLYSYNAPVFARSNFPRFAIPILPLVFLALSRWLPKDRRLLWGLAVVSSALAACSAIGLQNIFSELHRGH
jgi:Gpi18-like mannosyltransferase